MEPIFLQSAVFTFFPYRTGSGKLAPAPALFLGEISPYLRSFLVLSEDPELVPTYNVVSMTPARDESTRTRVDFSLSHPQGGGDHPLHKFVFSFEAETTDLLLLNALVHLTDDMDYIRVYGQEFPGHTDTPLTDEDYPDMMLTLAPTWMEEEATRLTEFFNETGVGVFGTYAHQDFQKAHEEMNEAVKAVQVHLFRGMYALSQKDPIAWQASMEWLLAEDVEDEEEADTRRQILMSLLTPNYLITHPLAHFHAHPEADSEELPPETQSEVDAEFMNIMNYNEILDDSLTASAAEKVSYPSAGHPDAILDLADPLRFFIEDPEYANVFSFIEKTDPDALTVARWDVRRHEVSERAVEEYGVPVLARALSLVVAFRALYRTKKIQPESTFVGTLVTLLSIPGDPYPWELEAITSDLIAYNSTLPVDVIASIGTGEGVSPFGVVLMDEITVRLHGEGWTPANIDARLQESTPRIQGVPSIRSLITLLLDVPNPRDFPEGEKPDPAIFFRALQDAFTMFGDLELYQVISHLIPVLGAAAWDEDDDGESSRGEFISEYVRGLVKAAAMRVSRRVSSPA